MMRNFQEIPFDQIAYSAAESRVTWRRVPPLLRLSVREVGVLNPLIVTETALPARSALVTGWLRFQAAREVGENSVPCHIYRSFPPKILLLMSLFDNLGHRQLNPVEQGLALGKLGEFYTSEEIRRTFIPMLGLQEHSTDWKPLVALTELHEDLQWAIADEVLTPEGAKALHSIPLGHSQHVLNLLRSVPAKSPDQTAIAQSFCDLLGKKDTSPLEILQEEGWAKLTPSETDDPQRRAEEELLKLETDLAAPPSLFAGRRQRPAGNNGHNVVAPGETVAPAEVLKAKGKKGKGGAAPTAGEVLAALQRRLGAKAQPHKG